MVSRSIFLGIDIGTSAAKVGVFSETGTLLGMATRSYPTDMPRPGWFEQAPESWWKAVRESVCEVLQAHPGQRIAAVGMTSQICAPTFVRSDGSPLRPAMVYWDTRANQCVAELYQRIPRERLTEELGVDLPPSPTWPLPRLLWLSKYEKQTLAQAYVLLQPKDYVSFKLTGEFATDVSSSRGLVNLASGRVATTVLQSLDLRTDLLPRLTEPYGIMGRVSNQAAEETGIEAGVPVMAGINDFNASALGTGLRNGDSFNISGTSDHIGTVISAPNRSCPQLTCAPYIPGLYLLYGVTSCGGGSWDWFRRAHGMNWDDLVAAAEKVPSDSEPLLFLPYLLGERAPVWDARASGAFVGLRTSHTAGHMARAVLEGVAFSVKQVLDLVETTAARPGAEMHISGGAARVALWNGIKASALNRPIVVNEANLVAARGAAMLAAIGSGLYPDYASAIENMTGAAQRVLPDAPLSTRYARLYDIYRELYPAMKDILHKLNESGVEPPKHASYSSVRPTAVIFSAGKIARGFIAHLLTLAGYDLVFVEKSKALVSLLRKRASYPIEVMGAPDKNIVVRNFKIMDSDDVEGIANAVGSASILFVSIGGGNLPQIAPTLAKSFQKLREKAGDKNLNVILCENYYQPAKWLRGMIDDLLSVSDREWFRAHIGIAEALVLRSCIEPTEEMRRKDPLSLKVQNAWQMPVDADALLGPPPKVPGLDLQENFQGRLTQKLFTYNAINAVVCYLGHLRGFTVLSDAANDPEIAQLAAQAGREASEALVRRFVFDPEDQRKFADAALAKYQKKEIVDPIERNARDPIRKLSRNDRLVGPACLALETGVRPVILARSIAAGLRYHCATDPAAVRLQEIINAEGVKAALKQVCGIEPDSELARMVLEDYAASESASDKSAQLSTPKNKLS